MAGLVRFFSDALVSTVDFWGRFNSSASMARTSLAMDFNTPPVLVTDLTITFGAAAVPSSDEMTDPSKWYRIEKDLYLHSAEQSAWLQVASAEETDLRPDDLVVTDIRVSEQHPNNGSDGSWESRPGGIWLQRSKYAGDSHHHAVTDVDVLFGTDAVDPRPKWSLLKQPLQLEKQSQAPVPRLTMRHGRPELRRDDAWTPLRVGADGKFKILQISDTHMVTGVGQCKDATDAKGRLLPKEEADPLTVKFMGQILDLEKPDLVVLTGDQLHHDILDSQSALFKVVAPLIERSLPFASVFGNHDDEGQYAISRNAQMSLLQSLPFSLSQPGLEKVDGVGNFYLQILGSSPSEQPLSTLYMLDSHGILSHTAPILGYGWINQTQIDWFTHTSQRLRKERKEEHQSKGPHIALAFQHIPIPEFGDKDLVVQGGYRGEPTEGPKFNSHYYDALAREGVAALACGHDHINDFCAMKPSKDGSGIGPWLCHAGGAGFGGYMQYGEDRYHRRMRVWELDGNDGSLRTWKRLEYNKEKVDEMVLVEGGAIVGPKDNAHGAIGQTPL